MSLPSARSSRSARSPLLVTVALAVGFALACGGSSSTAPPPAPPAPPAAAGSVGVAECDDYITKMEACLTTMDAATRTASEGAFKSAKDMWILAAATPQGKDGLKISCAAALAGIPATCSAPAAAGTPAATAVAPAATTPAAPAPSSAHPAETPDRTKRSPSMEEIRKQHHN